MTILNIPDQDTYLEYLKKNPDEPEALSNELLIGVTQFFRDEEPFRAAQAAIDDLVKTVKDDREIRAWVPGCSTGEEAYSIALTFTEALRRHGKSNQLRVFATDIDVRALASGRRGRYSAALDELLPEEVLDRHFNHIESGYQVAQHLRDTVVFSKHNVTHDPPFSKIDFLSCRNLFIYFNAKLQHRTLERFHYSLRHGGILFMGRSENLGEGAKLFADIDKKSRLFRASTTAVSRYRPVTAAEHVRLAELPRPMREPPINRDEFKAYRAISRTLAPPTIMLDEQDRPVHLHGDLAPYIELPSGQARFEIGNLIKPEFRSEFLALLLRVRHDKVLVSSRVLKISHAGDDWRFRIVVQPYTDKRPDQDSILISFPTVAAIVQQTAGDSGEVHEKAVSDERVEELEHELASMREHLRTLVEELETSNEELQSLNEELHSSNEELQSTNEELETSNEELQATNEELTTVNEELNIKGDEIRQSHAFLENILGTLDHPVLVTDRDMNILVSNHSASKLIGLGQNGRKLDSQAMFSELQITKTLSKLATRALGTGKRKRREIRINNRCYAAIAQPYTGHRDKVVGAILILDDITVLKAANEKLKEQQKLLEDLAGQKTAILDSLPANVALLDTNGVIVAVNKAWTKFGDDNGLKNPDDLIGINYIHICQDAEGDRAEEAPEIAQRLRDILDGRIEEFEIRYPCHAPHEKRWYRCCGTVVKTGEKIGGVVIMHIDETTAVELEQSLIDARKNAEDASNAKSLFLTTMSHELRTPLNAILGFSEMQKMEVFGPVGHEKYSEYADNIHSEADRLLGLINSILDLSKVESGKIEISDSKFDIADCQAAVFRLFDHNLHDTSLTLEADIPEIRPMLWADEGMTRQMLVNLIGNSVKFTEPGGTIRFEAREDADGGYILTVRDSGVGIPKHRLESITRPFEQVRSRFTTDNSGIGLGLAVVKSMIEHHGGELTIESEINVGTAVSLRFPSERVLRQSQ